MSTDVSQLTKGDIPTLRNIPVYTADGEQIGHVGDVYYDEDSERVESVGIAADGIGFARRMIPVQGATLDDEGLHLPYGRGDVEGAPDVEELDDDRYREVSDYYRQTEAGQTLTRSEEELRVGKTTEEAGRARLRKWVETEPVAVDVDLQRETARVVREQVDEPVSGAEIGEQEVEVTLQEERPVAEKRVVAKERVGLETDVETKRETVQDEVRKERVDVDDETR